MRALVPFGWSSRRLRARLRGEAGFTLLETSLSIGLLAIVATSLVALLAAGVTAQGLSRNRTVAQQAAQDQTESVRRLPYDSVGVPNGNPPGTLTTQTITKTGFSGTASFQVQYVSDPGPTSYATLANYKKVTVTIKDSGGLQLAKTVTYVAPPGRASYGGINYATVQAQVVDMGNNTPYPGATVSVASSNPSASRSDVTDAAGNVVFPALGANPSSSSYYDLSVAAPAGYQLLSDDVSPAGAAHHSLSPGETFNTALRIFKPATLYLNVTTSTGTPYVGISTITVSSSRQTQVLSVNGSSYTITTLNGESVVPGLQYTAVAKSTTPLCGNPAPKYVPDAYPNTMTSTVTVPMIACPSGTLLVTVKRSNGSNVGAGATVTVTLGPNNINFTGVTNASSQASFTVPTGTGYTVKAYSCALADASKSKTATNNTVVGGTNNLTLTFNSSTCPA